ncbi:MAG: PfkB family carbohydrate kinase [Capsulimonadaceae bacterium]|nr:PfkB family carbohydrate kinase [Capsulimonadaceae bacterium]
MKHVKPIDAPVIVGSMALDNVKTPAGEVTDSLGGAANYSAVAASFFTPVNLVGVIGDDFPQTHLDYLESRNIDLAGVDRIDGGKTFSWSGYYDFDLNIAHTTDTQLNVFADFKPTLPDAYRKASYVFLANIDPVLQLDVLNQVEKPRLTLCDTMNFWITSKRDALIEVLSRVDVAFMNDAEARQLTGCMSTIKAAKAIQKLGPKTVIVKKGEHGALLFHEDEHFSAPSYPLEDIVDPTGAGDSFAGGFIGYIASEGDITPKTMRRAVVYGSVMASFNVEDFSLNRMRRLTPHHIAERYRKFKEIAYFEAMEEAVL